jgi:hypothetical protein
MALLPITCNLTVDTLFLPSLPRLAHQCLPLLPLLRRPRSAYPPSLARATTREIKRKSSLTMRNRHPPIPPDCTLAAQGAPMDPEAPFLRPIVHLKPYPLSPTLNRTPPPYRSLMINRRQKSPPEPKCLPLRRTRNRRQSLIVPAQSSLGGEASSDAILASASDGGCALDAKTDTRMTSAQTQIVHPLRLRFFPSIPGEKFPPESPSCQMATGHQPVTSLRA